METLRLLEFGRILKLAVTAAVLSMLVSTGIAGADEVGLIATIAGKGASGVTGLRFAGDGGPATDAVLFQPFDAVEDKEGNIYIADTYNNRVRKVDAVSGLITTIAGNYRGFGGDGGPAVDSLLAMPYDLELDCKGDLYICDTGNASIRKIDMKTGIITTVAGIGQPGVAPAGNGGPAVLAPLVGPQSIALDKSGNMYIAEWGGYDVRKVDAGTGIISTVAGMGYYSTPWSEETLAINAFLGGPSGIAVDLNNNVYIIEPTGTNRISRIDSTTGMLSVYAGNGTAGYSGDGGDALSASFGPYMRGINLDGNGNMYVADANNHRIRKIDFATGIIETIAGNGISNYSGDGGPAIDASLKTPMRVSIGPSGNLIIADTYNSRIRKVILAAQTLECPQAVTVTPQVNGQNTVDLITWQPPANKGNVTGYKIYRNDAVLVADIAETGADSYSYTDADVAGCSNYCYSVVACNSQGQESANCASACIATPDVAPPSVPQNLTADAAGLVINLAWNPSTDGCEGAAAGYKVYTKDNVLLGTSIATTYSVQVDGDCTEHCYYVESFDSAGNVSMPSNNACAITPDMTPPAVPANVTVTLLDGGQATLAWSESADKCEGKAALYTVYDSNGVIKATTTSLSYTVSGLKEGASYCFKVAASDAAGNTSAPSQPACVVIPLVVTVKNIGKCGGTYNIGSAIPVTFRFTLNGLPVGPTMIGKPVPKLYYNVNGSWVEVVPPVTGSPDGLFKYIGNGVWKIIIKGCKQGQNNCDNPLQVGDYMVTALPNPNGNVIDPNLVFNPAPVCTFTLVEKGKK